MPATSPLAFTALFALASGCVSTDEPAQATTDPAASSSGSSELSGLHGPRGRELFASAFAGSNGRSCATCHVLDEHTALSVENVEARFAANPHEPLFDRLDADDPSASPLTFDHLRKGLVRVNLVLPANMDVIDVDGAVVTPANRTISVWRGVPTIENTAVTGPYQLDGREANLEVQAQSAITAHSEGPTVATRDLERIADFERDQFSSTRARFVATLIEYGVPPEHVPVPERTMHLTATEKRGRDVFELACAHCHGGATTQAITDRPLHDSLFFALRPNGNIIFDVAPGQPPTPRLVPHTGEFLNIGIGLMTGYGQRGQIPMFNDTVELPRYRFRFYSDGTRSHQVTDLPPIPVTASGDPDDLTPGTDENGAPIMGPSLGVQWFSTDPGRAAITGDPLDFEAFDVPQLRGLAHTAPYFHDSNSATLEQVADLYSRFILPFAPAINLPPINPPEGPGLPPEALSPAQKQDLVAFLRRL